MAKDFYHDNVRQALEKDGWKITNDPYYVEVDEVKYLIDFGAEPLIAYNPVQNEIVQWIK